MNPWILWQYLHNMIAAVVTGSVVMASIGAYYLLSGRFRTNTRRIFVRTGVIAGTIATLAMIFPTGDGQGRMIAEHQPVTLAAMEGLFDTAEGAPDRDDRPARHRQAAAGQSDRWCRTC